MGWTVGCRNGGRQACYRENDNNALKYFVFVFWEKDVLAQWEYKNQDEGKLRCFERFRNKAKFRGTWVRALGTSNG